MAPGERNAAGAAAPGARGDPEREDHVREFRALDEELWNVRNGIVLHRSAAAVWLFFAILAGASFAPAGFPCLAGAVIVALLPVAVAALHLWRHAVLRARAGFLEDMRRHHAAALGIEPGAPRGA